MQDLSAHLAAEREALVALLTGLRPEQWRTPSLCAGWTVREVVAHVLMPYELSVPRFLGLMVGARLDFDRAADRWAVADTRAPAELIAALRGTADRKFNVPGAPPAAALSHLVAHGQDIYRPLGVPSPTGPDTARIVLDQLLSRGRGLLPRGALDGLALTATDTSWTFGAGPEVSGSAVALVVTLAGRPAALDELAGPGAAHLRERLTGPSHGE